MPPTSLHVTVAKIEGVLAELAAAVAGTELPGALVSELSVSWAILLRMLPLGEPVYRGCPVCGRISRRTATFCGFCLHELTSAATYDA